MVHRNDLSAKVLKNTGIINLKHNNSEIRRLLNDCLRREFVNNNILSTCIAHV